jgi:hypothetical protein
VSDFGRVIPIIFDVLNQVSLQPNGAAATVNPGASYLEHVIVQIQFVSGSVSAVKPVSGYTTGTANLDSLFNDPTNLAAQTLTAGINVAGDWPDGMDNQTGGNAAPASGQFSIRLNCNTTNALNKIGQAAKLSGCKLELLCFDAGGNLILSQRIPFDLNMVQDTSAGTAPVSTGKTFLSADQLVATYVPFVCLPGATIILPQADGTKAVAINCVNGALNVTTLSPYVP